MKLKIRDSEKEEEVLEFWLDIQEDRIVVKSRTKGDKSGYYEFSIYPDKSWKKDLNGNLEDKENDTKNMS